MLDSQSRLAAQKNHFAGDWEESTFTRPMRSPFETDTASGTRPIVRSDPPAPVDVCLEEAALFEPPPVRQPSARPPALQKTSTRPLPIRPSRLPPPSFDAEATVKRGVSTEVLDAMRGRDSVRLRQAVRAAVTSDLSKTIEGPTLGEEVRLAQSRSSRKR